jgi:hypothetical protein
MCRFREAPLSWVSAKSPSWCGIGRSSTASSRSCSRSGQDHAHRRSREPAQGAARSAAAFASALARGQDARRYARLCGRALARREPLVRRTPRHRRAGRGRVVRRGDRRRARHGGRYAARAQERGRPPSIRGGGYQAADGFRRRDAGQLPALAARAVLRTESSGSCWLLLSAASRSSPRSRSGQRRAWPMLRGSPATPTHTSSSSGSI